MIAIAPRPGASGRGLRSRLDGHLCVASLRCHRKQPPRLLDSVAPTRRSSGVAARSCGRQSVDDRAARALYRGRWAIRRLPLGLDALLQARVGSLSGEERAGRAGSRDGTRVLGYGGRRVGAGGPASDAALPYSRRLRGRRAGRRRRHSQLRLCPGCSRLRGGRTASLTRFCTTASTATPKLRRADLHERLAGLLEQAEAPTSSSLSISSVPPAFERSSGPRRPRRWRPAGRATSSAPGSERSPATTQRCPELPHTGGGAPRRGLRRARTDRASLARIGTGAAEATCPGDVIGGYRVRAVAGRGGMGVVYRATTHARTPGRAQGDLALAAGDGRFRERFVRETRIAARLEHPNVVPVYAAGEEHGQLFIAMRFVAGADLRGTPATRRDGPSPGGGDRCPGRRALDAAHARGLVHRDVSPPTCSSRGGGRRAGVPDRLRAHSGRRRGDGLTKTGQWVGTLRTSRRTDPRGTLDALPTSTRSARCSTMLYRAVRSLPSELEALAAHLNEPPPRPSRNGAPGRSTARRACVEQRPWEALSLGRRPWAGGGRGRRGREGEARRAERPVGEAAPVQTGRRRRGRTRRTTLLVGLGAAAAVVAVALGAVVATGALSGAGGAPANPAGKVVGPPSTSPTTPTSWPPGRDVCGRCPSSGTIWCD